MQCKVCGYKYNPNIGEKRGNVEAGTEWENIPDEFICPVCGAPKMKFVSI